MTRYLEVAHEIAERVRAGELSIGAELAAVREAVHEHGATSTTVSRAYRHLADAGVITVGGRRRARVAAGGDIAAARLLEGDRVFRLAGSDDPALQLLMDHVAPLVAPVGARGSFQGLTALSRGDADGAAIHLRHLSGTYNAPFARALLRHRQPHLLHLWDREQGLLVARGNPAGLATAGDLRAVRVAKRETGAGTRVLLDQMLTDAGVTPHTVHGPELRSHLEVALAVASGIADAALGPRASATELDLMFLPLTSEPFDIALPGDALGAARPLIQALADPTVRTSIGELGGYDLAGAGVVRDLRDDAHAVPLKS